MTSTTQIFKSSSTLSQIPNILSNPSLFSSKNQYPILTFPRKTIQYHQLSCSVSSLFTPYLFCKSKNVSLYSSVVSFVAAQTSNWAQQNEELVVEKEEEEEKDDEGAKLYVGNLPFDVDHADLAQLFDEGGNVKIAEVIYNRDTNQSREFGFVTMSSVEEAEKAVEKLHGQRVNGRILTVTKAAPRGSKLYVGNLPFDVDHADLAQLFDEGGNVEVAEVIYDRDTNQSRGFGFVTMSSVEEAEKAVEKLHGQRVNGRILFVYKAAPKGSPRFTEPIFSLYVANLPWDVDSGRLEEIFSEHGKVTEACVVSDSDTGRSRGFGFVAYSTESEMHGAIAALDGETFSGRAIRVSVAVGRPKRNSF